MGEQVFPNHRGVTPMLWALASLALAELLVVHLLVALVWPSLAWTLTALSAVTIIWLVRWIRSWRRLPYRLTADRVLVLPMGSLRQVVVPLHQIASVHGQVDGEVLRRPGTLNLVPVAHPSRIVELAMPLPPRRRHGTPILRLAIRPDEPGRLDAAVQAAGISLAPPPAGQRAMLGA